MRGRERHGMTDSREYQTWESMMQRCYNPNAKYYSHYGARGITICDKWRNSFLAFYKDMGNRPADTTIDRIDNAKSYQPNNCRWASKTEQAHNTRQIKHGTGVAKSHNKTNPWKAKIKVNNKTIYLGYFQSFTDAVKARKQAELIYWGN